MNQIKKVKFENKENLYQYINLKLKAYICEETDWLANLSNASAVLGFLLENINWVGFYLYKNNELVLGPFQGKPACTHIALEKGVCGSAASYRKTIVVENVHHFPGHIACDSESQSEIVVPMIKNGSLIGVLDIDSPILERFDQEDQEGLEKFVEILTKHLCMN